MPEVRWLTDGELRREFPLVHRVLFATPGYDSFLRIREQIKKKVAERTLNGRQD